MNTLHVSRLAFKNVMGAGCQIKAHIDGEVPCVEFDLKGDVLQTITVQIGKPGTRVDDSFFRDEHLSIKEPMIGTEPFIQFSPPMWDDMVARIFQEMVDAWNEKYAAIEEDSDE